MTGCFTGLGACGELSCFLRCTLCVLVNSSFVSLRLGKAPVLSLVEPMLGAITTAMLNVYVNSVFGVYRNSEKRMPEKE